MTKRILYVHGISKIGGAEQELLRVLEHLDREQFLPFVVCPGSGPLLNQVRKLGVLVYPASLPPWRKIKTILKIPGAVWLIFRLIRDLRIDLVHVNDYWWGPLTSMAARIAKVPCVVHIRQEVEPIRIPQYWFKKPQRLIAVSNGIKKVVVESGVEASKIIVLHSGVDTSMSADAAEGKRIRDCYGLLPDQPVIGTVANIFPRKGHEFLIEAIREIQKELPRIHCLIIGEGDPDYRALLLERIEKAGLEKAITFTGFQSGVLAYIAAMDVFVLPSLLEGFGIVLLEAMIMERPVVATAVGGIPEIVEDQATGFLVPPGNSRALTEKILTFLRDPALRKRLGQAGRKRVLEHFSIDCMVSQLQKLYGELTV